MYPRFFLDEATWPLMRKVWKGHPSCPDADAPYILPRSRDRAG